MSGVLRNGPTAYIMFASKQLRDRCKLGNRFRASRPAALTSRDASARICISNPHFWRLDVSYSAPSIEEFQAGTVVKYAPISTGTTTQRNRKPPILAGTDQCRPGC